MIDCLIIGAGVVGLSIGYQFAKNDYNVVILEANDTVGKDTSYRNSAVLHAGLYYPQNTLKAKFCVPGKIALEHYCLMKGIPFRTLGKLIVATQSDQLIKLKSLYQQGQQNGAQGLELINSKTLNTLEPHVVGAGALLSPTTGIIDGSYLIESLKEEIIQRGGKIYTHATVTNCLPATGSFRIETLQSQLFQTKRLINASGLGAHKIAQHIQGLPRATIPRLYYAKGNYFKYMHPSPFKHLIYPIPDVAGLGIHATLDMQGSVRFGPDVEWVDNIDYKTNITRKPLFVTAIKQYYPELNEQLLVPDDEHTGIRPKICPPQEQPQDFLIQTQSTHGIKNLVNLYGIESPGLTSAFAIANYVFENI